jgi:hypothetical protein
MALKTQAEGASSSKIMRSKTKAYASIRNALYRGLRTKGCTFANYVTIHQEAHNALLDLKETLSETKQVADILAGIQDPSLQVGKRTVILSNPAKQARGF